MKTFDSILPMFVALIFVSFACALIGFGLLIDYKYNSQSQKNKRIGIALVGQIFLLGFVNVILSFIFNQIVRKDIIKFVDRKDLRIQINNQEIIGSKRDSIAREIGFVYNFYHNHTYPTTRIDLNLISKEKVYHIKLQRDSREKDIYWVFVLDYNETTNDDIGKIQTNVFDNFTFK